MVENTYSPAPWAAQSSVSDPGDLASLLDEVPGDIAAIRAVSQNLVVHYTGATDGSFVPIRGARLGEVDLRYAEAMLRRLKDLGDGRVLGPRPLDQRVVGCCRDFSLLFVALARLKGIPARLRMGYATYFRTGWYLDHVIVEAWDGRESRWRLVEPEVADGYLRDGAAGGPFDPLDVPPDRFVTGPRAWLAARAGDLDPERCVVSPDVEEPYTRAWPSLRHHVVQDLMALAKVEMILWDEWGILQDPDVLAGGALLDEVARATQDPLCPAQTLARLAREPALRVPGRVTSYSPAWQGPREVDVERSLGGRIEA